MDNSRIESLLRSGREVFSYLFLGLCAAYLYAAFVFRPKNPLAYPGIEDKLYIVLVMSAVAAIVFYLPLAARALSRARDRVRLPKIRINTRPAARALSAIGTRLHIPYVNIDFRPAARAATATFGALKSLGRWLGRAAVNIEAYAKMNFYPGRRWFFATLGFEIFLVILPLVLTNQKGLVEISALLFVAYAVFSYVNKVDDRVMIVTALVFLATCPILLILKEDAKAELSAIYAYYALCTGVLLQFADYAKNRDRYGAD